MTRTARIVAVTAAAALGLTLLSGCATPTSPSTPAVEPVVVKIGEIGGTTVKVALNQVVDLDTGSLPVTSYSGVVTETSIATFTPGRTDNGAELNPGLTPHRVGTTQVTLSNSDGGIQDVEFTLTVTK
ncbi:MAG TPA: hypothetical protein VFQ74_11295 [Pseudolysinimonas sp.]|nr:hypothetical protein [Pseudolysinimonas sp.]